LAKLTYAITSLAILTLVIPHLFDLVYHSPFLHRQLRRFCADYGMPITVIACSGLAYWGTFHGYVTEEGMTLPTTGAYTPAGGRDWVVKFWQLPGKYVGIAFPFGLVLWILFIFEYVVPFQRDISRPFCADHFSFQRECFGEQGCCNAFQTCIDSPWS
jgi:hypothetical protein